MAFLERCAFTCSTSTTMLSVKSIPPNTENWLRRVAPSSVLTRCSSVRSLLPSDTADFHLLASFGAGFQIHRPPERKGGGRRDVHSLAVSLTGPTTQFLLQLLILHTYQPMDRCSHTKSQLFVRTTDDCVAKNHRYLPCFRPVTIVLAIIMIRLDLYHPYQPSGHTKCFFELARFLLRHRCRWCHHHQQSVFVIISTILSH